MELPFSLVVDTDLAKPAPSTHGRWSNTDPDDWFWATNLPADYYEGR